MPSGIKIKFYIHATNGIFFFSFWSLSVCSPILTVPHIYFLSIDTEVETGKERYRTFMRSKDSYILCTRAPIR